MSIRIGSKVKFLNAKGGGIVKEFTDDKMAIVETSDGFDMPVLVTDLIVDTAVSYDGEVKKEERESLPVKPEAEAPKISFEEKKFASFTGEILLALVPENDQILHVSSFELYVINDSNYFLSFNASLRDGGVSSHITTAVVEPDTKQEIAAYSQTDLSKIKEFRLQGVFYKHGLYKPVEPVDLTFNIENISFYKGQNFTENDYFHQKALLYKKDETENMQKLVEGLKDADWSGIINTKEKRERTQFKKSPKVSVVEEIDLHIEELVDSHADLSNGEILNIQLSRFEIALQTAIKSNSQKIVFIHGVGNGVLKQELSKKLSKEYPDLKYQDASFKEYGFGATMVYLK